MIRSVYIKSTCIENAYTKKTFSFKNIYAWSICIVDSFVRDAYAKDAFDGNSCAKNVYIKDWSAYANNAYIDGNFAEKTWDVGTI